MADDLRARIAAALGTVEAVLDGWDYLNETSKFLLADAVIQELGLRVEYGALDHTDSGRLSDDNDLTPLRGEIMKTRYITDWHPHG